MLPLKELFAVAAGLLVIAGNAPYVRDTIRRRIAPHPYTWLIGAVVSTTVLAGQISDGAGIGALPTAISDLFTILIFVLSLRYGYQKATASDRVYLGIAFLGLIPWLITHDPTLSVVCAVAVDLMSFAPTIRKTNKEPYTENFGLYASNVLRHGLSLLSLEAYTIATALHSVAMVVLNSFMVFLIVNGRRRLSPRQ